MLYLLHIKNNVVAFSPWNIFITLYSALICKWDLNLSAISRFKEVNKWKTVISLTSIQAEKKSFQNKQH